MTRAGVRARIWVESGLLREETSCPLRSATLCQLSPQRKKERTLECPLPRYVRTARCRVRAARGATLRCRERHSRSGARAPSGQREGDSKRRWWWRAILWLVLPDSNRASRKASTLRWANRLRRHSDCRVRGIDRHGSSRPLARSRTMPSPVLRCRRSQLSFVCDPGRIPGDDNARGASHGGRRPWSARHQ